MRIVVFTGHPAFEDTPWWPVLLRTPGLGAVLVCRKLESRQLGDLWRRQRRNLAKHGPLWIPYRLGVLALALARRAVARPAATPRAARPPAAVNPEHVGAEDFTSEVLLARLRGWEPDLGVSIGAPILKPATFSLPRLGTLNLHLGRVPHFRGAPPAFWELHEGAAEIGATVHWVDAALDTGDVIAEAVAPLVARDTLESAEARAVELGRRVLGEALAKVAAGGDEGTPQGSGGRTYRTPTLRQRARLALRLRVRRLRAVLQPRAVAKTLAAVWMLAVWRKLRDVTRTIRGTHPVRVFTFHRVSDLCRDGMTVRPAVFLRMVAYIRRHHDVICVAAAVERLKRRGRFRRPTAVITFDDGYRSVYDYARPALTDHGIPGCCFVTTDLVGTDRRFAHDEANPVAVYLEVMDWGELRDLLDLGWELGCHTATHPRLSACDEPALRYELAEPLRAVRERLGLDGVAMAYPFGGPDDITPAAVAMVRATGYVACFNDSGGENHAAADPFALNRIELGGDHDTLAWKTRVHGFELGRWRGR